MRVLYFSKAVCIDNMVLLFCTVVYGDNVVLYFCTVVGASTLQTEASLEIGE